MDRKTQRVLYSAFAEEEVGIVATGEAICYPYRATSSPSAIDFEIFKSFRQQQVRVNVLTEDRGGLWLKKEDEKKSAFASHISSTSMPFNLTDYTNREAIVNFLDGLGLAPTRPIRHTSP